MSRRTRIEEFWCEPEGDGQRFHVIVYQEFLPDGMKALKKMQNPAAGAVTWLGDDRYKDVRTGTIGRRVA